MMHARGGLRGIAIWLLSCLLALVATGCTKIETSLLSHGEPTRTAALEKVKGMS